MSGRNDTEVLPEVNFPINLILIKWHQRTGPSLTAKYKYGTYHKGSFRGGSNKHLSLITCEDKIFIP